MDHRRVQLLESKDFLPFMGRIEQILLSVGKKYSALRKSNKQRTVPLIHHNRWDTATDTPSDAFFKRTFFTSNAELKPATYLRVMNWMMGFDHGFDTIKSEDPYLDQVVGGSEWSATAWTQAGKALVSKDKIIQAMRDDNSDHLYAQLTRPVGYWW